MAMSHESTRIPDKTHYPVAHALECMRRYELLERHVAMLEQIIAEEETLPFSSRITQQVDEWEPWKKQTLTQIAFIRRSAKGYHKDAEALAGQAGK